MDKSGFDYKSYLKWVDNLRKTDKDIDNWLKHFLLQQAQRVVSAAKEKTPIDTGFLRSAYQIGGQEIALTQTVDKQGKIHYDVDLDNTQKEDISLVNDDLSVTIFNPAEYASYVEYGHHAYEGRYMLTKSVNEVTSVMPQRLKKQFDEYLKSKGVI